MELFQDPVHLLVFGMSDVEPSGCLLSSLNGVFDAVCVLLVTTREEFCVCAYDTIALLAAHGI